MKLTPQLAELFNLQCLTPVNSGQNHIAATSSSDTCIEEPHTAWWQDLKLMCQHCDVQLTPKLSKGFELSSKHLRVCAEGLEPEAKKALWLQISCLGDL